LSSRADSPGVSGDREGPDPGRRDTLALFTHNYPYGEGETFLEQEVPLLSRRFEKVFIISANLRDPKTRPTPSNVLSERVTFSLSVYQKVGALRFLADPRFWRELWWIIAVYRKAPSPSILKSMLVSLCRASLVTRYVSRQLLMAARTSPGRLYLYSYWANDCALGIGLVRSSAVATKICRAHHGDLYHHRQESGYLPYRDLLFKSVGGISFVSEHGRRYTVARMGRDYASFGVAKLGTRSTLGEALSATYHPRELVLVSCSWVSPVKRLDLIVDALRLLPSRYRVRWVHVGTGPLMEEIRVQAAAVASERDNVDVAFPGYVANVDLQLLYRRENAQLFINVSRSEGIPVSIMEAFACGIPAVAPDVGGISELVEPSTGFLLRRDCTAAEIVNALTAWVDMTEKEKVRMSLAAFSKWKECHDADSNYADFIAIHFSPDPGKG
jgi:glycosyltransferase involved in cell wall biosynthesis